MSSVGLLAATLWSCIVVSAVRRAWALRGVRGVRGRRAAYVGAVRRAWAPRGVRGHRVAHIFNSPESPFQRCYYRLVN